MKIGFKIERCGDWEMAEVRISLRKEKGSSAVSAHRLSRLMRKAPRASLRAEDWTGFI